MKNIIFVFLLAFMLASCSSSESTSTPTLPVTATVSDDLYAAEFNASSDSILYNMDAGSGEVETIGNIPAQITDIAMMGGTLYGVSFSDLYVINQLTADVTFVGSTGYFNINARASIAGILYAGTTSGELIIIEENDGSVSYVGSYGAGISSSGDLAFDSKGDLYATVNVDGQVNDSLALINRFTGAASIIGDAGADEIFGITFFENQLYGVLFDGTLVTIDTTSGTSTVVGQGKTFIDRLSEFNSTSSGTLNIGGLTTR
jgi:hypothetical protein